MSSVVIGLQPRYSHSLHYTVGSEHKTELNTGYIAGCDNVRLFLLWCLVLCDGVVKVSLS